MRRQKLALVAHFVLENFPSFYITARRSLYIFYVPFEALVVVCVTKFICIRLVEIFKLSYVLVVVATYGK